jgi:phosphoglycerol geranylgeranyltransferase
MLGTIEKYLLQKIKTDGKIHITLIDPEKTTPLQASNLANIAEISGTSSIMIGGSTNISPSHLEDVVKSVKKNVKIPVILFPSNLTGISSYADAIWFMSLLNSVDPYYLTGVQVLSAPIIKKIGLEPIPLGYIIVGEGGTVAFIGKAIPVPYDKPELAAAHALAGQFLGMRFIYLEAGSGALTPVSTEMIRVVKNYINVPLIIGGGIKTGKQAYKVASSGADILVTGNITEKEETQSNIYEIINSIKY